jgi:hypothetical protein
MYKIKLTFLTLLALIIFLACNTSAELINIKVDPISKEENLAFNPFNKDYPSPLESDRGWGGGSFPWEIVDGIRKYNEWYHGLAFCGGKNNWCGEPCGWRQATINFGRIVKFNKLVVWHHGLEHVPNIYKIQYWDGYNWVDVFSTTEGKKYLKYPSINPKEWYESFSTPTENIFPTVKASKVRFLLNNCDIEHGWIYEIEVYYDDKIEEQFSPTIAILSPFDGATISKNELTIKYAIRNPSKEPVTKLQVLIDGRPVSQTRGVQIKPKDEETGEITVTVPERDFVLSLIAENKYSAGVPSAIRLYWKSDKPKPEEFVIKPKLYILAIGVSKYQNKDLRLQFASKDAKDFVEAMKLQKGKLYQDVVVKLLTDEEATKDDILDGLEWLQRQVTSKDVAMVFIAGHGVNDSTGVYYYLPANADLEKLKRTGVPYSDIKNTVAGLAGKVLMFVDTCHSGNVFGGKRAVTDITGVINELSSAENGVVVFASSTGRQYSLEDPEWGNGAFTKALVEGLKGRADLLGKGKITINMLDAFIAERVKELTKGKQTPVTAKPQTVPDFPIAVK